MPKPVLTSLKVAAFLVLLLAYNIVGVHTIHVMAQERDRTMTSTSSYMGGPTPIVTYTTDHRLIVRQRAAITSTQLCLERASGLSYRDGTPAPSTVNADSPIEQVCLYVPEWLALRDAAMAKSINPPTHSRPGGK